MTGDLKLRPSVVSTIVLAAFLLSPIVGQAALPTNSQNSTTNLNSSWQYVGATQQNVWYSSQTMVNPDNVAGLKLAWRAYVPEVSGTPVVNDGMVYVASGAYNPGYVYALNESTGALVWAAGPGKETGLNFSTAAGVTVDKGSVFAGTEDSYLVSLDAKTGYLNWKAPITQGIVGNPTGYYNGPQAIPLVHNDEVIISDTEGDVGSRGFVRSFNETTGALIWTFYTVPPSPMNNTDQQEYHNTWGNCVECGGGAVWNVPALDPKNGIIYFGVGNPAPSYNSSQRAPYPNDTNLFTDCIVALNVTTGKLLWYYQEIPADPHDWDQGMPVAVFHTLINGKMTEVVGAGSKGGYYYELNATDGALIHKVALGIHLNGDAKPTPQGVVVYPGSFGGVNTYSSFDPLTNLIYAMAYNQPSNYTVGPVDFSSSNKSLQGSVDNPVPEVQSNTTLYAIDASSGNVAWSRNMWGLGGGVSSTNDLVFTQDGSQNYYSLDARTGKVLWSYAPTNSDSYLGLWNWGPPSIVDGMVFETLFGPTGGGVLAFTTDTSIVDTSLLQDMTNTTASSSPSALSSVQSRLSTAYLTQTNDGGITLVSGANATQTSSRNAISSSTTVVDSPTSSSTQTKQITVVTSPEGGTSSPTLLNESWASLLTSMGIFFIALTLIASIFLIAGSRRKKDNLEGEVAEKVSQTVDG